MEKEILILTQRCVNYFHIFQNSVSPLKNLHLLDEPLLPVGLGLLMHGDFLPT